MKIGCYKDLSAAVECLQNILSDTTTESKNELNEVDVVPVEDRKSFVSEQLIMQQFGKALRRVTQLRDTYTTTACDVCEQLRKDLQSLRSYSCKKGFSSEKMSEIIDLLYINNTKYEDEDKFIDSIMICKYCADKLCGNKEVARSAFNRLAVVETPECIKVLNIYERSLIKHCVTCTTIIRLGQVSNKHRPAKELNFALKGRIAYLPVNVTSNASFLPDRLLNVDSLVLLVGGQPTTKQRVWVSAVDLRKVHAALLWLRDNNKLYQNVPAYTLTDLQQIIVEKIAGNRADVEPADDCLIKKLDEASKSHLYENFTVQPLSADYPPDAMVDYQFNKLGGLSSNVFDSDLDLRAYPELFPTGENGIRDAFRKVKIGTSDFIKSRLLNKHSKFRLNISYLFHNFQVQEISNMCNSVGHMLRCVTGKAMSAKEFYDRLMAKDGEIKSKMFSLLANVRGTREYFGKLGMDVRWMLKRLGAPTFFVTCSTAEWFSNALINHLRTINSDVPNVDQMTPSELCAMDPVTVSIHFHQKWDAIFTNLIKAKDTPLFGPLEDFVYRIEYQARGSAHVHALIWVKDAPVVGKNTLEEVKKYIDKNVTCAMPDATTSPTLSKLVAEFQVHKCGKYCTKVYKRNGRFARKCRFGFPRPVKVETQLNDVIDCLSVNKTKQPRKRLYHLCREFSEIFINDYNPALLLANEANVDVQFVGHAGSRLAHYICDYMTKSETTEQDALWNDIFSSAKSVGTNAMSFMLQAVRNRQVGANEAADRLLGHRLYRKSRQLRFADLQPAEKVKRVLKPAAEIQEILKVDPNSEDIFFQHWVLDVYPARPDELEDMSLYDLLRWYEKAKIISNKESLQLKGFDQHLKRRRNRPYIITHQTVNPHQSEEKKELYFYYLLKLFKPWRRESDLLHEGSTYFNTFQSKSDRLPDMVMYNDHNVKVEEEQKLIEIAIRERREEQQRLQEVDVLEDHETALEGCADSHAVTAMQEVIDAHRNVAKQDPDSVQLNAMYQSLNADQKRVVDRVVGKITDDEKIHLLISGQAGTGKSLVIDVINRMVSRSSGINCLTVAVTAPTGLAAFNVGGTTVHRLLCLPVEHGKPANYSRLGQDQLAVVRHTLTGLKLLVIDELCMVSSLTLLYIHLRLTEITGSFEAFGGVSVVAFADFLQLPPVKGNQPFIAVSFLEAKQRIGSIAAPRIWQAFEYEELTINMRQGGDQNYAQLLSSARIGTMSDEHHEVLKERFITPGRRASVDETCDHYKQLTETGLTPIILVPRTELCEKINRVMLTRIGNEIYTLPALDSLDTVVAPQMLAKVTAAHKKIEQDTTRTAGLESCLQLCIGGKVMLRRNKNVEAGLVNGSMGTVISFAAKQSSNEINEITKIEVKFDNITEPVFIERDSCTFEVLKNVFYTRKQFPIMLSFAITVHKAQGLSLKSAIVDAGPASFGSGMLYVALSRVTSLTGLHLIDFTRSKLICDSKALSEYNRLRRIYTPHLGDLQPAKLEKRKKTKVTLESHLRRIKEPEVLHTTSNLKRHHSSILDIASDVKPAKIKRANLPPQPCSSDLNNIKRKQKKHQPSTSNNHFTSANDETDDAAIVAVTHQSIFNFCDFQSLSTEKQQVISQRLNFEFVTDELTTTKIVENEVSKSLQEQLRSETNESASTRIYQVAVDCNCLFRSLSLGVTGTQDQHDIVRCYIVNHMMHGDVQQQLEQSFQTRVAAPQTEQHMTYSDHLAEMQRDGVWGTEHEIIAAAHLFDCSIVCYSRYNSTKFCLQHFPPHFLTSGTCNNTCKHPTLYLINSSGTHYNLAIVSLKSSAEE